MHKSNTQQDEWVTNEVGNNAPESIQQRRNEQKLNNQFEMSKLMHLFSYIKEVKRRENQNNNHMCT